MKIRLLGLIGLAMGLAFPIFAQTSVTQSTEKKEINFSGTHYWSGTPKAIQIDRDRIILEMEISGVRVNDSGDGLFNGASVYIAVLHYENTRLKKPIGKRQTHCRRAVIAYGCALSRLRFADRAYSCYVMPQSKYSSGS